MASIAKQHRIQKGIYYRNITGLRHHLYGCPRPRSNTNFRSTALKMSITPITNHQSSPTNQPTNQPITNQQSPNQSSTADRKGPNSVSGVHPCASDFRERMLIVYPTTGALDSRKKKSPPKQNQNQTKHHGALVTSSRLALQGKPTKRDETQPITTNQIICYDMFHGMFHGMFVY